MKHIPSHSKTVVTPDAMLAWMGGKRSKFKHGKKHHSSRRAIDRSVVARAGTKGVAAAVTPMDSAHGGLASSYSTTGDVSTSNSYKQAHRTHKQVGSAGKRARSPSSFSSNSSEGFTSGLEEGEEDQGCLSLRDEAQPLKSKSKRTMQQMTSAGNTIDSNEHAVTEQCKLRAVSKLSKSRHSQVHQAAGSLDLQAIELPK